MKKRIAWILSICMIASFGTHTLAEETISVIENETIQTINDNTESAASGDVAETPEEESNHSSIPEMESEEMPALVENVFEPEKDFPPSDLPEGSQMPEATIEESPANETKAIDFDFWVAWDRSEAEGADLYAGDRIILRAECDEDFDGKHLQWQVAEKLAEELSEDEEEWNSIPGATSAEYSFMVDAEMENWRWRLRVTLESGEALYSDEMMLPQIGERHERDRSQPNPEAETDHVEMPAEAVVESLPWAEISFATDVPTEEISFAAEITLAADIMNPCDNMQLQWQYAEYREDAADIEWLDVPDATEMAHSYRLDEENANWIWRLLITLAEEEGIEEVETGHDPMDTDNEDESVTDELILDEDVPLWAEPTSELVESEPEVLEEIESMEVVATPAA